MPEHRTPAQIAADRAEAERLYPSDLDVTEMLPQLQRSLRDGDVERARACLRGLMILTMMGEVPGWLREQARSLTPVKV